MVIISHRWSHHANHWYADPTQRGLLTGITLSNKHTQLRILGSYWPVPHAANQHLLSLHAHVVQYLHQHSPLSDFPEQEQHHPLTYIQNLNMRGGTKPFYGGTSTPAGWTPTMGARTPLCIAGPIKWDGATPAEQSPTTYNQPKYALNGPPSHQSPGLITSSPSRAPPCLNPLVCT